MSETVRSFVAFDVDNELVVRRLSEVQGMLVNTGACLKLVQPQNIHLTMRFLGNISIPMVDLIYEEMKQIFFARFDIELRGLGVFPSLSFLIAIRPSFREASSKGWRWPGPSP